MAMRVQLALIFEDEDLFNNFVLPYKSSKTLNSTIIRCLSAYYRDSRVRDLVENTKEEELSNITDGSQDIINSIRETLSVQNFLVNELMMDIENGTEDINSILKKSSNLSEEIVKASKTEPEKPLAIATNTDIDIIKRAVLSLARTIGDTNVPNILGVSQEPQAVVQEPVIVQEPMMQTVAKVGVSQEPMVVQEPVTAQPLVQESMIQPVAQEPITEEEEDASEAMKELLSSLF